MGSVTVSSDSSSECVNVAVILRRTLCIPVSEQDVVGMLDLVVWERGAAPLGHGAVSRVAAMPHSLQNTAPRMARSRAGVSRRGRQLTPFLLVSFSAAHCVFSLDLLGLVEGLVGIPLRLLLVPTKKFARLLRSLGRLGERTAARAVNTGSPARGPRYLCHP